MVSDPAARKEYLETLSQESDRLTHLIDNVLRYSKLERTSTIPMTEVISVPDWIDRITPRLIGRLKQCGMALDISSPTEGRWKTDPPAMEQVIFNLIDNAAKYAKSQSDSPVQLIAEIVDHEVIISIADHGPGVPRRYSAKFFSHSANLRSKQQKLQRVLDSAWHWRDKPRIPTVHTDLRTNRWWWCYICPTYPNGNAEK